MERRRADGDIPEHHLDDDGVATVHTGADLPGGHHTAQAATLQPGEPATAKGA